MGKKVALLVGVGRCQGNNDKFPALQCPENGVAELETILRNPKIGGFDQVESLINPDLGTFQRRMGEFFTYPSVGKDDLVLLYFTGHGIKDMGGDFYLTTADTTFIGNRVNAGTAVPGSFVQNIFRNCYAQRKVIILDCCFGAAFAEGFLTMDDGSVDVEADLGGEGWVVLTAATARNYALEQEGEPLSVYTRYLVEGLKTGAAAQEGKDYVYVRDLHSYVQAKVQTAAPTMCPTIFNARQGESITLAKVVIGNPELKLRKAIARYIDAEAAEITPVGKRYLKNLALSYSIDLKRAEEILNAELRPLRTRRNHLREYAAAYREAVEHYSGLPERTRQELRDLQRLLNLRDEDVDLIHARIPIPAPKSAPQPAPSNRTAAASSEPAPTLSPELISALKPEPQPTLTQPKSTPKPSQAQPLKPKPASQTENQINRRKLLTWAGWGGGGLIVFASVRPLINALAPSPQATPSSNESLPKVTTLSPEADLPNPVAVDLDNLLTKEFEVVTVNDTGEVNDRQTKLASYFAESLGNGIELVMMQIPGGSFLMGSPDSEEGRQDNEGPQREVTVPTFFMGQFQVTQAQYQAVMGENPSYFSENGANRPVEQVSWHDAVAFCEKLTQQTGQTYRLPSEAEWEYACRAGTTTPFHFGATITTDLANYNGNSTYGFGPKGTYREQTTEVGSFPANAFGLYDMHGNVWEWCLDHWHENYQGAPTDGTAWLSSEEAAPRVRRGGSWLINPRYCRSAYRILGNPGYRNSFDGFRVMCEARRT